ncbi:hypothetical protein WICPIJ_004541 [Wickerhamomyces pijperi]|uniref:Uncharacterized protein n=1 Tax=Wickerhamomyces pijperi TaxID=599730 RepID=A0A9P8Q5M7_WICPI|nr:hypothetical protein WICPIJ_004541 [Wickerhamomyces pijperi]
MAAFGTSNWSSCLYQNLKSSSLVNKIGDASGVVDLAFVTLKSVGINGFGLGKCSWSFIGKDLISEINSADSLEMECSVPYHFSFKSVSTDCETNNTLAFSMVKASPNSTIKGSSQRLSTVLLRVNCSGMYLPTFCRSLAYLETVLAADDFCLNLKFMILTSFNSSQIHCCDCVSTCRKTIGPAFTLQEVQQAPFAFMANQVGVVVGRLDIPVFLMIRNVERNGDLVLGHHRFGLDDSLQLVTGEDLTLEGWNGTAVVWDS